MLRADDRHAAFDLLPFQSSGHRRRYDADMVVDSRRDPLGSQGTAPWSLPTMASAGWDAGLRGVPRGASSGSSAIRTLARNGLRGNRASGAFPRHFPQGDFKGASPEEIRDSRVFRPGGPLRNRRPVKYESTIRSRGLLPVCRPAGSNPKDPCRMSPGGLIRRYTDNQGCFDLSFAVCSLL